MYVCAGSWSNCSSSSRRRYLARTFVRTSSSGKSSPFLVRASRRLAPISNMRQESTVRLPARELGPRLEEHVHADRDQRSQRQADAEGAQCSPPAHRRLAPEPAERTLVAGAGGT